MTGICTRGLRRRGGAALLLLVGLCPGGVAARPAAGATPQGAPPQGATQQARTPHAEAVAALADTRAAITAIIQGSQVTANDPDPYQQAARRALDALNGPGTPAKDSESNDRAGALGHMNWLLHRPGSAAWTAAVQGAWMNATVAAGQLRKSLTAHGLRQYEDDTTNALEALEMAVGRNTGADTLGGLEGARATTDLAVPDGGTIVAGCEAPARAPAYGIAHGSLLYVAVPVAQGAARLPAVLGVRDITLGHGFVVEHTAATGMPKDLCAGHKQAAADPSAAGSGTRQSASLPPRLYTEAQAIAGKAVFMKACTSCHGRALEGKSAPPNAGTRFLAKAGKLGWSVSDVRTLVVSAMPFDNPGSLTPAQ